jgi:hypothetical protein
VQFRHETYSLRTKRPFLLSDEPSERFPEEVHDEARRDQKHKLGTELPVFDHVFIRGSLLGPRLNHRITYETHETLNGEENQKAKEDIVE